MPHRFELFFDEAFAAVNESEALLVVIDSFIQDRDGSSQFAGTFVELLCLVDLISVGMLQAEKGISLLLNFGMVFGGLESLLLIVQLRFFF